MLKLNRPSRPRPWTALPTGVALALALGGAFFARDAEAAKILGRLDNFMSLQNPVWLEARDPEHHGYSFREPVPTVRAEFRRLYPHIPKEICVVALSENLRHGRLPILVRIGGGRTTPVTIVVAPGTTLTLKNTDPFPHRLYAVGLKTFAPNDTLPGNSREWTPPEPGVFEIRDELAPSLRMWVVSEPHAAAIAYPSLKGDFALNLEEPGEYRLQAYFAGEKVGNELLVKLDNRDVDVRRSPIKLTPPKSATKSAGKAKAP